MTLPLLENALFGGTLLEVFHPICHVSFLHFLINFVVNGEHMIVSLYLLKGGGPGSRNILSCIPTYTCQHFLHVHIQACIGGAHGCLNELV